MKPEQPEREQRFSQKINENVSELQQRVLQWGGQHSPAQAPAPLISSSWDMLKEVWGLSKGPCAEASLTRSENQSRAAEKLKVLFKPGSSLASLAQCIT